MVTTVSPDRSMTLVDANSKTRTVNAKNFTRLVGTNRTNCQGDRRKERDGPI